MTDLELVMTIRAAVKGNIAVFYPCQCDEHESGQEHFIDQLTNSIMAIQRQSALDALIEESYREAQRIIDRVNKPCPPVVWKTVDCPTCGAIAGLACEAGEGMRQPRQTHPARTELFYDLTEYRGQ